MINPYERACYVVSDNILARKGKFNINDIIKDTEEKIKGQFNSREEMIDYIKYKLNSMLEFGLIGATSIYYFSI